jgi:uncharacterized membrane protein
MLKTLTIPGIDWLDTLALVWFLVLWIGYTLYADWRAYKTVSLSSRMGNWRRVWMTQMALRENRMADVQVLINLARSAQFFASTSILILGALIALLGYTEKAVDVVAELPFTRAGSARLWEIKILLLLLVFVYAFFKFSWCIRQYGFASIMIGATPQAKDVCDEDAAHLERTTRVLDYSAGNYNNGLRAYYFGVSALGWFLHPLMMMIGVVIVIGVLWHREFRSSTLDVLAQIPKP